MCIDRWMPWAREYSTAATSHGMRRSSSSSKNSHSGRMSRKKNLLVIIAERKEENEVNVIVGIGYREHYHLLMVAMPLILLSRVVFFLPFQL